LPEHDLRQLPCPLPLERALALVDALAPGQAVRVLTPQRPLPLLDLLAARGLQVTTALLTDGGARLLIQRPARA
jgi:TusA-related sulfurtransferase